tara:strand:- start:176 stop:790 length:615 start_codon:yes stop_codon:yes gene_type:complete
MRKALIALDRQHVGQIGRYITSVGAHKDIDGDGKKQIHEAEAIWTARYSLSTEIYLRELGHYVIPLSDGTYKERAQRFNEYHAKMGGIAIYLALHANAGGGSYGCWFYHHASKKGPELANSIADAMLEIVPEISHQRVKPARPDDWTRNALYTIKHVGAPIAICCEPFFMDNADHKKIINKRGMNDIGLAIAKGLDRWIQQQPR